MTRYPNGNSESALSRRAKRCWRFLKRASKFIVPWLSPEWKFWFRAGQLAVEFARSLRDAIWVINRLNRGRLTYDDLDQMLALLRTNIGRMTSFIQDRLGPGWKAFFRSRELASEFSRSLRDTSWLINQLIRGRLTYNDHDRMLNIVKENSWRMARLIRDKSIQDGSPQAHPS